MKATTHVQLVSWLLGGLGLVSLGVGFLAGAGVMMGDVPNNGTPEILDGPCLMASGVIGLLAGIRNSRRESWLFGVVGLVAFGATGLFLGGWMSPHSIVALYGLVVYLSPSGRAVFRKATAR